MFTLHPDHIGFPSHGSVLRAGKYVQNGCVVSVFIALPVLAHIGFLKTSVLVGVWIWSRLYGPLFASAGGVLIQDYPYVFCLHLPSLFWVHLTSIWIYLSLSCCTIIICISVSTTALLLSQSNYFILIRFNVIFSFSFDLFPYQTPAVACFISKELFVCMLLMSNLALGLDVLFSIYFSKLTAPFKLPRLKILIYPSYMSCIANFVWSQYTIFRFVDSPLLNMI